MGLVSVSPFSVQVSAAFRICMTAKIHRFVKAMLATFFCWIVLTIPTLAQAKLPKIDPLPGPGVCPVPDNLQSTSRTLIVPNYKTSRPLVADKAGTDYVVIEYNASQKQPSPDHTDPNAGLTSWTDYKHTFDLSKRDTYNTIRANGSFLPVIDTKEKVAVRVCGLHFTDVLTVTTSPNGVPEGGADIRGTTPVTPVASLSSTLDTLQSGVATGGTTNLPGLGLNAPASLPSLSLSGITPGNLGAEDQTPGKFPSYSPATLTASGKQVALLLYSVAANAKELTRLIGRTEGESYPGNVRIDATPTESETPCQAVTEAERRGQEEKARTGKNEKAAPGSVKGVAFIVKRVLCNVEMDNGNKSDSAAFDKDMTDTQNINAQISSLATALSSQAFASNTLALLNNFSTLVGVLDLADLARKPHCQGIPGLQPGKLSPDDLNKLTPDALGNLTLLQVRNIDLKQIKDEKLKAKIKSIQDALNALPPASLANDIPLCSVFEQQKIADFWNSYNNELFYIVRAIDSDTNSRLLSKENPERGDDLDCEAGGLKVTLESPYQPDPVPTTPDPMANDKFERFTGCRLEELSSKLNELRKFLRIIDQETTGLYNLMNEWYFDSRVEQTDLLPPLTTNGFVRISIVVQRGFTPFTLANASGTFAPTLTANVLPTSTAASTSTPAHAVKTILVEVHRVANFNLMGGVMVMRIPTASFAVQASPTAAVASSASPTGFIGTCGTNTVNVPAPATPPAAGASFNYSCIVQTQKTDWQVAGMAGIVWFPFGHDYFPRRSGYANYRRNLLPSLLVATSVTSLGNSMGGLNWEPVSGLDFFAGIGSGHRTSLPSGFTANSAVPLGTTVSNVTSEHVGLTLGMGWDLSTFISLFSSKSTSVASMP